MRTPNWLSNYAPLIVTVVLASVPGMVGYIHQGRDVTDARQDIDALQRWREDVDKLNLSYRMTAAEEGLKATNQRLDASLQTLSARIAEMNQLLGSVDTKIAVLTQRLEMQAPGRRTELRPSK